MSDSFRIPLCRSEFLQDFTIELGRLLGPRYRYGNFVAEVDFCEHEDDEFERLTIWIRSVYRTRVQLSLWDDQTLWIGMAFLPELGEKYQVGFYPDFDSLGIEGVVEALAETASITTLLCYDKSPEPLMRKIWKYDGEVEIVGVI